MTLLGVVLALGCSPSQEGARVIGTPLLGQDAEIDLFKVSEAVWAREAKHGYRAPAEPERVFLRLKPRPRSMAVSLSSSRTRLRPWADTLAPRSSVPEMAPQEQAIAVFWPCGPAARP
jgi:hypothetical protein